MGSTRVGVAAATVLALSCARDSRADVAGDEDIDAHADAVAKHVSRSLDAASKKALLADRAALSFATLVPIFGTYELDTTVFGEVRPAAVLFDWLLGGLVPAALAVTALAGDGVLSPDSRAGLAWTALGLYASTRIGILIIGNTHITEYNRRLSLKLGLALAPNSGVVSVGLRW
jgi:hypothetical protein